MKKGLLLTLIGLLLLLSLALPLKSAKAYTSTDILDMQYQAFYVKSNSQVDSSEFHSIYSDVANDTLILIACPYVISSLVDNVRTNTMYYYFGIHKIDLSTYEFYFGDTSNDRDFVTYSLSNFSSSYTSRNTNTYICLPYSLRNNDINYALFQSGLIDNEVSGYTLYPGYYVNDVQYFYLENFYQVQQLQTQYDNLLEDYGELNTEYNRYKTLYETSNTNFFKNIFDSLSSIFNVEVFPGFTIGTFIFIPLMFIVLILLLRLAL